MYVLFTLCFCGSKWRVLGRIDFSPDGSALAYPDKDTVVVLNTSDWSQSSTLNSTDVSNHYSIVQWSPCGQYLAATTTKGDIVIFHVSIRGVRKVSKHPNSTSICGLMWNPSGKYKKSVCLESIVDF